MSYDICLREPKTGMVATLDTPHQMRGGTYIHGGTYNAELNVTYNYARHFYATIGEHGIRSIYGMTGADSIPILTKAAMKLEEDYNEDYWAPTEGNARKALMELVALAKMRPDCIWGGD